MNAFKRANEMNESFTVKLGTIFTVVLNECD